MKEPALFVNQEEEGLVLDNDVLKTVSDRRSHRAYEKRQLSEDVLSAILKAGLQAPSARNRQPWHFSVVQNPEMVQRVHDAAAQELMKADDNNRSLRFKDPGFQIFYHAPTVIFLFGEKDFSWTQVDCGIAVENMALAAQSLGVGSVILGLPAPAFTGPEGDRLRRSLKCPEGYDFVIALALGYATDTKAAHDLNYNHVSRITENEMIEGIKPFTEMTSTELFVILTGGRGVMQQMYLQDILKEYAAKYGDTADLVTMVHKMAEEK